MSNIKKMLFLSACLCLMLLIPKNEVHGEDENFVLKINITGGNGEYVVEILDDPYYAEKNPTVFVNTDIEGNLAKVLYENKQAIASVLKDGEVSFKVNKGGTYYITKGTPSDNTSPNNKPSKFVSPKTGIE